MLIEQDGHFASGGGLFFSAGGSNRGHGVKTGSKATTLKARFLKDGETHTRFSILTLERPATLTFGYSL